VVVAAVVMLNILELIMEIVPNFPTNTDRDLSNEVLNWSKIYQNSYNLKAIFVYQNKISFGIRKYRPKSSFRRDFGNLD
jgi:hypothetical protein